MTTFGSVCSGIEAASVAWHSLGWRAAWLAEIEPAPSAVLSHHYPDVPNLGDMTKIATMVRDCVVPAPDVFCGGTPCQAFSIAGLRNSLDDARGNLSLVFCEIADEIDIRRQADGLLPSIIFWENVPGVLSTKDNAFGCFLAGLAGEDDPLVPAGDKWTNAGCVFGPKRTVAWRVLDAQYFGVAQRRRRVFVVASARDGFDPTAVLFEFDGVRRDSAPRRETGQVAAGTLAARTEGGGFPGTDESCSGYVQPVGLQRPVLTCVSNAEGAKPPVFLTCSNLAKTVNNQPPLMSFVAPVSPTLRAGGNQTGGDRPPGTDVDTCETLIALSVALSGREGGGTAELGDEVAGCLRASGGGGGGGGGGDKAHVLAPIAFMADDYKDGTGRGQPIVAAPIGPDQEHNAMSDCFGTLKAKANGGGFEGTVMQTNMAVRRLTPTECARLQGFPDDYLSQVIIRGKPMADGPMYKALGNSWAVPNVRWIGERIDRALKAGKL